MRRVLIVGLALAALAAPVIARESPYDAPESAYRPDYRPGRGVPMYDPREGANVRVGVQCTLFINGREPYDGRCNIGRRPGGRVTVIDTVERQYKIIRNEEDPSEAEFYRDGDWIDTVYVKSGCWTGPKVSFCAR